MNEILETICRNLEKKNKKAWVAAYREWTQYIESAQIEILHIIRTEMGDEYIERMEEGYRIACAGTQA